MGVAAVIVSDATEIELVQRALESVLYQTHPVDEIVIVEAKRRIMDDLEQLVELLGCDATIDHCLSYNASIARNRGADLCDSEFICFLDADDEWSPHMIHDRMALVEDDVCMITSRYAVKAEDDSMEFLLPIGPIEDSIMGGNTLGPTSYMMLRRSTFMEVGGFDPRLVYKQEWDLWIRMMEKGRLVISPQLGGIKYFNGFSASRRSKTVDDGWKAFVRKYGLYYRHHPVEADAVLEQYRKDMSIFRQYPEPFFGPLGWVQTHVFRRLPSWVNLDFYWGRGGRDRTVTKEGAANPKRDAGDTAEESKVFYFIHPPFKRGRSLTL